MGKMINYLEGKIEEFRIEGKTPEVIMLSYDNLEKLRAELEKARGYNSNILVFLGLDVYGSADPIVSKDGIYIREKLY